MQITPFLTTLLLLVIIALSLLLTSTEARNARHHKRAITDDYEYRDTQDYTDNAGIFIDSVPIRTTTSSRHLKNHQKTNRFPKLRKFFAESDRFYH